MNTVICIITSFVLWFLEKHIHIIAFRAWNLRIIHWLETVLGKELSKVCCQNRKVYPLALKCSDTGTFFFYSLEYYEPTARAANTVRAKLEFKMILKVRKYSAIARLSPHLGNRNQLYKHRTGRN